MLQRATLMRAVAAALCGGLAASGCGGRTLACSQVLYPPSAINFDFGNVRNLDFAGAHTDRRGRPTIRPVKDFSALLRRAVTVRVCVDAICRQLPVTTQAASIRDQRLESARTAAASVEVLDVHGRSLYRTAAPITIRKGEPNGPGCDPLIYGADLTLDAATHRLVQLFAPPT
jgi:hypothetical protein